MRRFAVRRLAFVAPLSLACKHTHLAIEPKMASGSKIKRRFHRHLKAPNQLEHSAPVQMSTEPAPVAVDFCGDVSGLGEVRAALRDLEHPRCFIASVLDERDRLF